MEETLTPEMKALIASLGELVKADPRCTKVQAAVDEYERSAELNELIAEYNTQQNLLADAVSRAETPGEEFRKAVQSRIDSLYDQITTHPVYVSYVDAKADFDALTTEIFGELQFVITGQRPCSHNCASCHSSCASREEE